MTHKTRRNSLIALIAFLVVGIIAAVVYMLRVGGGSLPVTGQAPDFSAMNTNGQRFQFSKLEGKIRLVTWFYTRCPDECPLTAFRMSQIQDQLTAQGDFGNKVAFVSMTVNPQYDTSPVIQKWSSHFHPNYGGWNFIYADVNQTNDILKKWGIQAKVSDNSEDIEHVLKTELVDGNGNIRKVYEGTDLNVDEVESDIQNLLSRSNW